MVITDDVLLNNYGFECNHPEFVLKKFYKTGNNPEYRIMIETESNLNHTGIQYNVSMWKCNDTGAIIKRASLSDIKDTMDLQNICNLCGITL